MIRLVTLVHRPQRRAGRSAAGPRDSSVWHLRARCGQTPRQTGVVFDEVSPPDDQASGSNEEATDMPLFMDVHNIDGGVPAADVAAAHQADLAAQGAHGVNYLRYWVDEQAGKIFCLVEAPNAEAANTVHREAHGLVADEIYLVSEHS